MKLSLTINGKMRSTDVAPLKRLLDVLREDFALTGTKEGCGEGECGACSVLLDGQLVNACLIPACQAAGCDVVSVEGLAASDGTVSTLQRSFVEAGAAQCGICTPGMIVAAHAFLQSGRPASDFAIREALAGNLCRCTGYQKIIEAVMLAARAEAR